MKKFFKSWKLYFYISMLLYSILFGALFWILFFGYLEVFHNFNEPGYKTIYYFFIPYFLIFFLVKYLQYHFLLKEVKDTKLFD